MSRSARSRVKPVIGIGCDQATEGRPACRLGLDYADSIVRAGGLPLVLPLLESETDVAAALGEVDGLRILAGAALRAGIPVLGICGGCQLINIVLGGDLVQDIPALVPGAIAHRGPRGGPPAAHPVRILPGTLLEALVRRSEVRVNSFHHQAAGRIGQGLRVSAASADRVVEAVEAATQGRFLLGVQWHPEREDDDVSRAIFAGLVETARARAKGEGR
jgi:putative glutamine amidotransferase